MENNVNNSKKKTLSQEVVTYLIFGVLTTFVGWAVSFAIMLGGRAIFSISNDDTTSGEAHAKAGNKEKQNKLFHMCPLR